MDAEIIGFQEIFHQDALLTSLTGTQFESTDVQVLGAAGNSPVVGLATTFPLDGNAESIEDIPDEVISGISGLSDDLKKFSRPVLKAKVKLTDEISCTVLVAHLKSKRPVFLDNEDQDDFTIKALGETRALLRRAVEAAGLRSIIVKDTVDNSDPIILIGDLNDSTRSVTNNIISGPMPWKYDSLVTKKKYWDAVLYSSFDIISQKSFKVDWYTHIYNGHYEALDHIYVSQEFFFRNQQRIGDVDFVHVLADHLKDDMLSKDKLPEWKSDHGQVIVSLSLK